MHAAGKDRPGDWQDICEFMPIFWILSVGYVRTDGIGRSLKGVWGIEVNE
jgi:hypothetical protein